MRGQFIPVRKSEIVAGLAAADGPANAAGDQFAEFCRLLGLTLHYEFFDELERLRDGYFHFDPVVVAENGGAGQTEAAYADLIETLTRLLGRANFVEVPPEEIERSYRERGLLPVEVKSPVEAYRSLRFFKRGERSEEVPARDWLGRPAGSRLETLYDDVVLVAAVKPQPSPVRHRFRRQQGPVPGSVLIKYFHGIASADLNTLLPEVRVIMNRRDRWVLGLPALAGGVPLLLKLAPTIAVLLLLAGVQLGANRSVETDHLKQALAVLSGLVALGSFAAHQWLKYQRKALRYQVVIRDSIYFRNADNNGGVFNALAGAAEEQEFKEAVLAYAFLRTQPAVKAELDSRIETWLGQRFGVDVDFEVDDGLAKLERYGLLTREGERLAVVPLGEVLARLDRQWDTYFNFDRAVTA